jgi:hypothetical protein
VLLLLLLYACMHACMHWQAVLAAKSWEDVDTVTYEHGGALLCQQLPHTSMSCVMSLCGAVVLAESGSMLMVTGYWTDSDTAMRCAVALLPHNEGNNTTCMATPDVPTVSEDVFVAAGVKPLSADDMKCDAVTLLKLPCTLFDDNAFTVVLRKDTQSARRGNSGDCVIDRCSVHNLPQVSSLEWQQPDGHHFKLLDGAYSLSLSTRFVSFHCHGCTYGHLSLHLSVSCLSVSPSPSPSVCLSAGRSVSPSVSRSLGLSHLFLSVSPLSFALSLFSLSLSLSLSLALCSSFLGSSFLSQPSVRSLSLFSVPRALQVCPTHSLTLGIRPTLSDPPLAPRPLAPRCGICRSDLSVVSASVASMLSVSWTSPTTFWSAMCLRYWPILFSSHTRSHGTASILWCGRRRRTHPICVHLEAQAQVRVRVHVRPTTAAFMHCPPQPWPPSSPLSASPRSSRVLRL